MAFLAVMALYIVSTMGYGVHKCTSDGTASLILLFGESPCEYVHTHVDEHGNSYTHSHAPGKHEEACGHGHHEGECGGHHGNGCGGHHTAGHHDGSCVGAGHAEEHDGCCSTDVYVLTHDQNTVEDNLQFLPQALLVADVMQDILAMQVPAATFSSDYGRLLQALHPKDGQQAVLCTFRI